MNTAYQELASRFEKISQIDHAVTFLSWDQMVMMPVQGNERRAKSIAELAGIRHELLNDVELGAVFDDAEGCANDEQESASIREMKRQWQQTISMPAELVKAQIIAGSKCEHGWRTQRDANDWFGFLANFKEVVKLSREEALCRQGVDAARFTTPYDALLDLHCAGDNQALIKNIFAQLKTDLPDLLSKVLENKTLDKPLDLAGQYTRAAQQELSERLMTILGFNFDAGRLDVSMHPFSTGVKGDQRITTRFSDSEFTQALLGTAHETGHASYESGLPDAWDGLPVGEACNMCIHESQSLLFEKQIFISRAFTRYFTPVVHELLADTRRFDANSLWQSFADVRPGLIRVEADEVTYPLHIMLRYEIESSLINFELEADDIPELWDEKMQDYLGIATKDNFRDGCLQDIYWTDGSFGYFPSYTLGAVNAAQIFATIKHQYPDWQSQLEAGDIGFVRDWLSKHVWQQGSLLESQSLMRTATGEETNTSYFLEHLQARYLRAEH